MNKNIKITCFVPSTQSISPVWLSIDCLKTSSCSISLIRRPDGEPARMGWETRGWVGYNCLLASWTPWCPSERWMEHLSTGFGAPSGRLLSCWHTIHLAPPLWHDAAWSWTWSSTYPGGKWSTPCGQPASHILQPGISWQRSAKCSWG